MRVIRRVERRVPGRVLQRVPETLFSPTTTQPQHATQQQLTLNSTQQHLQLKAPRALKSDTDSTSSDVTVSGLRRINEADGVFLVTSVRVAS